MYIIPYYLRYFVEITLGASLDISPLNIDIIFIGLIAPTVNGVLITEVCLHGDVTIYVLCLSSFRRDSNLAIDEYGLNYNDFGNILRNVESEISPHLLCRLSV